MPAGCSDKDWEALLRLARRLARNPALATSVKAALTPEDNPRLVAAVLVLADLVMQGWVLRVTKKHSLEVAVPPRGVDASTEKARVRAQELLKRDEQLMTPSVRRFVQSMEAPREHNGAFISVFSLMRDGGELADGLTAALHLESVPNGEALRRAVDPYVQVIRNGSERCVHTGLRLTDIWRYFRHTWVNQYKSTPGRSMMILVRDRAASHHPIIGIAALGSAIVQLAQRDEWIGWDADHFVASLVAHPDVEHARWVVDRLDGRLQELYLGDLLEDGLYWPSLWNDPDRDAIARLRKESVARRNDHQRFGRRSQFRDVDPAAPNAWRDRALTDLYRSKRCGELADLLEARLAIIRFLDPPTSAGLSAALEDRDGRRAIRAVLRRAKADAIGTEIADLTVCGAVAPYNALLAGKLVSMLAVSPTVIRAYHERYCDHPSQIASSMAGRPTSRRSNLAFIGTTSLYGSHSSQYNRITIPAEVLGGDRDLRFERIGHSRSFGTSHLSDTAVNALVALSEQSQNGARVKSIFGEGVNPKLRKVRTGLDELGWPSDVLLQHGRRRLIYGIELSTNLLRYLLGLDRTPTYRFRPDVENDVERVGSWWIKRWLASRIASEECLKTVSEHSLERPVRHGARVALPPTESQGEFTAH
jgi:hypothetical protein